MQIHDLSPFKDDPQVLAVGWLGDKIPTGETQQVFQQKLRRLCAHPLRITRGYHSCPFCNGSAARGSGEVEVRGENGLLYVAPALISHYVDVHNYKPPEDFIRALTA